MESGSRSTKIYINIHFGKREERMYREKKSKKYKNISRFHTIRTTPVLSNYMETTVW